MNDSLYDDVVDERSCAKLCGYPLCSNPPSEKLSGQKFHISTKLNKVFDVTDRKVGTLLLLKDQILQLFLVAPRKKVLT